MSFFFFFLHFVCFQICYLDWAYTPFRLSLFFCLFREKNWDLCLLPQKIQIMTTGKYPILAHLENTDWAWRPLYPSAVPHQSQFHWWKKLLNVTCLPNKSYFLWYRMSSMYSTHLLLLFFVLSRSHAVDNAGLISSSVFLWMIPKMWAMFKNGLDISDLHLSPFDVVDISAKRSLFADSHFSVVV